MQFDVIASTKAMAKRRVDNILYESFKNKERDKIKLNINREKVFLFHRDGLSNYYFSRFARKIKYLEFISVT